MDSTDRRVHVSSDSTDRKAHVSSDSTDRKAHVSSVFTTQSVNCSCYYHNTLAMQRLDDTCQGQPFGCLCLHFEIVCKASKHLFKWCKTMFTVDFVDMTYTLDVGRY